MDSEEDCFEIIHTDRLTKNCIDFSTILKILEIMKINTLYHNTLIYLGIKGNISKPSINGYLNVYKR